MQGRGGINESNGESFGAGRTLGAFQSEWGNDTGEASPVLREALKLARLEGVLAQLRGARVFIALAPSDKAATDGSSAKSEMSVACIEAADGRLGLLVFSGIDSLARWRSDARPVPMTAPNAAAAALEESAVALIIDPSGPFPFTVTLPDVVDLAPGDHRELAIKKISSLASDLGLQTFGVIPSINGPIKLRISESEAQKLVQVLNVRSDIHAFIPEGIEIEADREEFDREEFDREEFDRENIDGSRG